MRKFGLIGFPLEHSFSPGFFKEKFSRENITDATYDLYPVEDIREVRPLLNEPSIVGLNVTIPYKESIMPLLSELDHDAQAIGAVNTLKRRGEKWMGYNTDHLAFKQSIEPLISGNEQALILGTGGSSKAVAYALAALGIPFKKVSRTSGDLSYDQLTETVVQRHNILVNCTPVGMSPGADAIPEIPIQGLGEDHLVYDLIYNPLETRLMKEARGRGARVKNGLEMLEGQANASWKIWNQL